MALIRIQYETNYSQISSKTVGSSLQNTYSLKKEDLPILTDENHTFKNWKCDGVLLFEGLILNSSEEKTYTFVAEWEAKTNYVMEKSLKNKLLSVMKIKEFYPQFMEAIALEMSLMREELKKKRNFFNIYSQDSNGLSKISKTFGYTPNLIVDDSLQMYLKETESIPYRIKNKSTYDGYILIFKMISKLGELYNYYWNGKKLVRAIDWVKLEEFLNNYSFPYPIGYYENSFKSIPAIKNFSVTSSADSIMLDTSYGDKYKWIDAQGNPRNQEGYAILDAGLKNEGEKITDGVSNWVLDLNPVVTPTKHIGLEYSPYKLGDLVSDTFVYSEDGVNFYSDSTLNNRVSIPEDAVDLKQVQDTLYSYKENKLISSNYFQYLSVGTEYNRRVPIIPHTGIQINCFTDDSGSYNGINDTYEYSVENLKIRGAMSYAYTRSFETKGKMYLDNTDSSGALDLFNLDDLPYWVLDRDTSKSVETPTIEDFKYISCGNGKLNIPTMEQLDLFNNNDLIVYYTFNDEDGNLSIKDYSSNELDCSLKSTDENYPTTKKVNGIIGKSVDFDGKTYCESDLSIALPTDEFTLSLWFKVTSDTLYWINDEQYVFDFMCMSLRFKKSENKMYFTWGENNEFEFSFDVEQNEVYNLQVVNSNENNLRNFNFYLNGELLNDNPFDVSSIPVIPYGKICIGSDLNGSNTYVGIIDDYTITKKLYSDDERKFIFENRLGIITHLNNKLASWELYQDGECKELEVDGKSLMVLNSYVNCNTVKDEFISLAEKSEEENSLKNVKYLGRSNHYPIQEESFVVNYTRFNGKEDETLKIHSNEKGELYIVDEDYNPKERLIDGHINYETGDYELNSVTTTKVVQELVDMKSPTLSDSETYNFDNQEFKDWIFEDYEDVEEIESEEDTKVNYDMSPNGIVPTDIIGTVVKIDDILSFDTTDINAKVGKRDTVYGCYVNAGTKFKFTVMGNATIKLNVSFVQTEPQAQMQMDEENVVESVLGDMIFEVSEGEHELKFLSNQTYIKSIDVDIDTDKFVMAKIIDKEVDFIKNKVVFDTKTVKHSSIRYYPNATPNRMTNCISLYDGAMVKIHVNGRTRLRIKFDEFNSEYITINDDLISSNSITYDYLYKGLEKDLIIKSSDSSKPIGIYSIEVSDKYTSSGLCELQFNMNDVTTDELKEGYLQVKYVVEGIERLAYDEDGRLIGPFITNSSVDYKHRTFSITTQRAFEGNLIVDYSYSTNLDFKEGTAITCNYITKNSTDITEIGFENENHELLAYMTFPKVESNNEQNYISTLFVVQKTS